MTNRDWKEIENELTGLVPAQRSQGEKLPSPNHRVPQAIHADEGVLLAHIADALVQEDIE